MTDQQPHTPTTEEVRLAHAESVTLHKMEEPGLTHANEMFDRWHAAEIAAAEQRGAEAALMCLNDTSWEHHDQTDDFPCTRCLTRAQHVIDQYRADLLEGNA